MDEPGRRIRKQDPVSTTGLGLPSTLDVSVHNSSEPCPHRQDLVAASVRRIGNSLDALLHESKRTSQVRAIKKSTTLVNQQSSDGLFISSDQIRYRKGAVTLHDICEEYIQFITVNSSADEQTVTTTSENGGDDQNAAPELEIIPVNVGTITAASSSAGEKRIAQISVITINENLARNSASVIRKSVEEMHVTPENDCEKSHDESDPSADKMVSEGNDDAQEDLFPPVNGVKSAVSIEIDEKLVPLTEPAKETDVASEEADENVAEPLANGVDHDANDDIEEEDAMEDEEMASVDDSANEVPPPVAEPPVVAPEVATADEEPAGVVDECSRMDTDEYDAESATEVLAKSSPEAMPDVEDEAPTSTPPPQPASNEPVTTESADCAEAAVEPSSPEVASADKSELSPSIPVTDSIASPIRTTTSPSPAEVDHEEKKTSEESDEKAEEPIHSADENVESPAEKVKSPEEPVRSPEEPVKSPQEKVDSAEEKVNSPAEKETVEPSPAANSMAEEKLICKEEVTTPTPEDFVSNSMNLDDASRDSKTADEVATSVTKSEPVEKKPQITVKEPLKEVTLTPTAGGVKRRVEVTDDVEPERDGGISSSSSSSETENTQDCKRIRFDESIFEEDERERLIREFVERSTDNSEEIGKNCDKLQHEIAALSDLARAKELEWNSIMRLLKLKEEMLERILFKKRHLDGHTNKADLSNLNKQLKNFVSSSSLLDSSNKSSVRSESNVPTTLNSQVTVVPISSCSSSSGGAATCTAAVSANGLFSVLSSQSELTKVSSATSITPAVSLDSLNKLRLHRPILPKPPTSSGMSLGTTITSQPSHSSFLSQSAAAAAAVAAQLSSSTQTHPSMSSAAAVAAAAAAANSLIIDQNSVVGEGRQGPTVDVKSIIAEFRAKNPDSLPRRGRRNLPFASRVAECGPRFIHNSALLSMANMAAMQSAPHVRMAASSTTHNDHRPTNFMLGQDNAVSASLTRSDLPPQVRHSNIDSLMLTVNTSGGTMPINSSQQVGGGNASHAVSSAAAAAAAAVAGMSNQTFQEALVKLSKMNEKRDMSMNPVGMHKVASSSSSTSSPHLAPPPPYPEVTLHPVLAPQQSSGSPPVQNSLLHGILTKSNNNVVSRGGGGAADHHQASSTMGGGLGPSSSMQQHRPTTFSPTLARLLTTPDRSRASRASISQSTRNTKSALSEILNSKKTRTEVTITPVTTSTPSAKNIPDVVMDDDDESEATDRLIIDEGREATADGTSNVIPADQVPECQGCHKKAAQFVCAGCGNQWYCSRECQVQAWEDHSEMCSG